MTTVEVEQQQSLRPGMPMAAAGAVVFFTSFVILVLEILGSRLLAPFIGVTLQTYTAVIGTILTGISLGTWLGGSLADRFEPRRILGLVICVGGAFVLLTVPVARWFGPQLGTHGAFAIIGLSFMTLFMPAAILSAVNPTIVKIQLSSLRHTGRTVGRLSALATAGAITGTFATGFFLVANFRIAPVVAISGAALIVLGALLMLLLMNSAKPVAITMTVVLLAGGVGVSLTMAAPNPCAIESSYFCMQVLRYTNKPEVRILKLDNIYNSAQDLSDPKSLVFWYTQVVGAVADHVAPPGAPISTLGLGAGAMTIPRYVSATRPGSTNEVLEIDPSVVKIDEEQFGLKLSPDLQVHIGDARTRIRKLAGKNYDFVLGDAFGGDSVPWQLTTKQFDREVADTISSHGIYAMNVIDFGQLRFARAEAETLKSVFSDVIAIGFPGNTRGVHTGNIELLASKTPLNATAVNAWFPPGVKHVILDGTALDNFIGSSQVLTDDFAPVDQLITNPNF